MNTNKTKLIVATVIIAITLLTWSLATPMWLAPDEPHHFTNAYIYANHGTIPENKFYDLPLGIVKSKAVSNLFTHIILKSDRRLSYEATSPPFVKNLDAPIDLNEAESLFINLSAWDLEHLSIPAWERDFRFLTPAVGFNLGQASTAGWKVDNKNIIVKDESVSISTELLDSLLIEGKKSPYMLFAISYTGLLRPYGHNVEKKSAVLVDNGSVVKLINPGTYEELSVDDDFVVFKKYPEDNIVIKVMPLELSSWKQHSYYYYFPPFYYGVLAGVIKAVSIFGSNIISEAFFARSFSVCLGLFALIFVYRSLLIIWPDDENSAIAGMVLFALWPMNSFMFSVINADTMLNFLFTAAFYYIIRILFLHKSSTRDWVLFAIVASLAAFTKITGALLVLIWWTLLMPTLIVLKKERFKPVFLLPPTLMFVGPYLMWHRTTGLFLSGAGMNITVMQYIKVYLTGRFWMKFESFSGNFGSLNNLMPAFAYYILFSFIAVISLLFIFILVKGFKKGNRANHLYLLFCTALSIIFFLVMEYVNLKKYGFVIQGRYFLFLALPGIILARTAAAQSDKYFKPVREAIFNLFVIAVVIINLCALFNYIAQNYI